MNQESDMDNSTLLLDSPNVCPGTWATIPPLAECRTLLHKKAFPVVHDLAKNALFEIDSLLAVAKDATRRRGDFYVDAGDVGLTDKWGSIPVPELPIDEIIKRIETAGAWMVMKHVEVDPRYKRVLDEFTDFVHQIAGPESAKLLLNPEMLVFITSPHRVTPYHFDAEVNFLVQIRGSKDVWVCDPMDRTITTEDEIERYYAVSISSGNFKPDAESKAQKFALTPGDAIHIPSHGAHWVKNHDNVSVSLSLNFEFPKWMKRDVYYANHYLRKLGLKPKPPGRSALVDRSKSLISKAIRFAKRITKRSG